MNPILKVNNLSVNFKRKHDHICAVRNVSFEISPNEITAIIGESGCGKSALAKSIAKLLPENSEVTSGSIFYKDHSLLKLDEKNFRNIRGKEIGMIFQDPHLSLNPTMKIGKQICETLLTHKICSFKDVKASCYRILEKVQIKNPKVCFDMYPYQLSGGMKQRILMAAAIACKPNLLIADEPTTALDVTIQSQILKIIKDLQSSDKMSVLFITHDMTVVSNLCNKIIVMYAGEIIEMGETKKIINDPSHPYTKMLLDSVPTLEKNKKSNRLRPIEGFLPVINNDISHCSFWQRCPSAMPICKTKRPHLLKNKQNTRCWLYDREEEEINRSEVAEKILQTR